MLKGGRRRKEKRESNSNRGDESEGGERAGRRAQGADEG
jgi:hypothetical protein